MAQSTMIKEIDGVKILKLYDGAWYCNFTDYKVRQIRNRGYYNKDQFLEWCAANSICPIL